MFEKQKLKLENKKNVRLDFDKFEILVKPYISLNDKISILRTYFDAFLSENDIIVAYMQAEYSIVLQIIDLCTDIDIDNAGVDDLISSGVWDKVVAEISNYWKLRQDIDTIVKFMREDSIAEKSVGTVIDNLSGKVLGLIDKLSQIDVSKEGFEILSQEIKKLGEIESPVLDAPKEKPVRKKPTKKLE